VRAQGGRRVWRRRDVPQRLHELAAGDRPVAVQDDVDQQQPPVPTAQMTVPALTVDLDREITAQADPDADGLPHRHQ